MPKIRSISKTASNKSCSELNFIQKSSRAHMSISPTSGAREFERSVHLKSYNVQKWKLDSLWGSALPKIRITSKKASNKSCSELNFVKKVGGHICLSPSEVELGGFSISIHYKISNVLIFGASLPVALVWEIDICARGLFCTKFNSEQLLFEAFFDVMCIFGSVAPQGESNFPFLYIIRFKTYGSLKPPTPIVREIDMCTY